MHDRRTGSINKHRKRANIQPSRARSRGSRGCRQRSRSAARWCRGKTGGADGRSPPGLRLELKIRAKMRNDGGTKAEMESMRTGGIPESELNLLAVNLNVGYVVLEHGGHVDLATAEMACVSSEPQSDRTDAHCAQRTSGNMSLENTMSRQVLPHAPSPTTTSLRRRGLDISAHRTHTRVSTSRNTHTHGAVYGCRCEMHVCARH